MNKKETILRKLLIKLLQKKYNQNITSILDITLIAMNVRKGGLVILNEDYLWIIDILNDLNLGYSIIQQWEYTKEGAVHMQYDENNNPIKTLKNSKFDYTIFIYNKKYKLEKFGIELKECWNNETKKCHNYIQEKQGDIYGYMNMANKIKLGSLEYVISIPEIGKKIYGIMGPQTIMDMDHPKLKFHIEKRCDDATNALRFLIGDIYPEIKCIAICYEDQWYFGKKIVDFFDTIFMKLS